MSYRTDGQYYDDILRYWHNHPPSKLARVADLTYLICIVLLWPPTQFVLCVAAALASLWAYGYAINHVAYALEVVYELPQQVILYPAFFGPFVLFLFLVRNVD